ncbi:unnamed protein product, partial [Mesorhabditis belari]|uniref:Uncharacterized protein n=1 Tax=Mesorhabditis belari TaxID=2138241 RepID=A0AAF3F4C7_9BILA
MYKEMGPIGDKPTPSPVIAGRPINEVPSSWHDRRSTPPLVNEESKPGSSKRKAAASRSGGEQAKRRTHRKFKISDLPVPVSVVEDGRSEVARVAFLVFIVAIVYAFAQLLFFGMYIGLWALTAYGDRYLHDVYCILVL